MGSSWELVDIDPTGHDEIGKEDDKWDDDVNFMHELEESLNKLRWLNEKLGTSSDKDIIPNKNKLKESTKKLVANQTYDKVIKLFIDTR